MNVVVKKVLGSGMSCKKREVKGKCYKEKSETRIYKKVPVEWHPIIVQIYPCHNEGEVC